MTFLNICLVFLGGGLGSVLRFCISNYVKSEGGFPWATFITNLMACFIIGILVSLSLKSHLTSNQRLLLITGFCGGFSTFSTYSYETMALIQNGNYWLAGVYVVSSIVFGLLFLVLAYRIF